MARRRKSLKKLLLNWRVLLLILFLVGSLASIAAYGLTYGIDIGGGVALVAKPDHPVSGDTVNGIITSLQNRVNTFGIKDISIEAQHESETGETLFVIKVANVTLEEAKQIKNIIESQGVLYLEFDGKVFATGSDVTVPSGQYGLDLQKGPTNWRVGFQLSDKAQNNFKKIASHKVGWPVDIFLDPPVNSLMVVSPQVYQELQDVNAFNGEAGVQAPTLLERIQEALNITVIQYSNQTPEEIVNNATALNKTAIILADVPKGIYSNVSSIVKNDNLKIAVSYYTPQNGEDYPSFVRRVLHLYGPYSLAFDPAEGNQAQLEITGGAATKEAALDEAKMMYAVLRSGSLAVKLHVISEQYISPTLGQDFKKQAGIAGLGALIAVLLIVYFHYRRWKIAIPVASTSLFEVTIILGIAALIHWNLDLPSIAGIIAAIGTGVDQQVVITDELLGGTGSVLRRSTLSRMARAFFVILASATTTIVAMSFLLIYFVGTLKGFAVTTILGVLVGILVTRPAYAEIAKYLLTEG